MSTKKNPEAGNLGPETGDACSEVDVPMIPRLTEPEAARLTTKIQLRLDMIADSIELVIPMIAEAKAGNAHQALGYRSWGEYVADKFGGTLGRLTKAQRLPVVEMLASQGMSTRQIGPVVGAAFKTVARDLVEAAVSNDTPTSFQIPATLAEASVELESIDAFVTEATAQRTELERTLYALRCYTEAYESYRGDVR